MGNRSRKRATTTFGRVARRVDPPNVMWPGEDSGFEPSTYSPAGGLQQGAQMMENILDDPAGVRRAIRGSWGWRILLGGAALAAVLAGLSALLHLL